MVILQKKVAGLSEASLTRFVRRARQAAGVRGSANVLVTTSAAMRTLNRQFRKKDQATDVLSFPSNSVDGGKTAGEVAISADIAAQNAARYGHSPAVEIKILALHGILHLAGFDHENDNGVMERKETRLRQQLNLPAALIERVRPAKQATAKGRRKPSVRARRTP